MTVDPDAHETSVEFFGYGPEAGTGQLEETVVEEPGALRRLVDNPSNQMNQVMRVLTLIATIFIPLGFIAGMYGMNFSREASPWNMPELYWRFGYPFAPLLMGLVAAVMLIFFRRKGWLGEKRD